MALDVGKYVKELDSIKLSKVACGVCGAQIMYVAKKDAMCQFCESHSSASPKGANADSAKQLDAIRDLIGGANWDAASTYFSAYAGQKTDPLLTYAAGIFYWYYSDSKYHNLDHNLFGYMEQNAKNMYDSLHITVTAKDYLYRAMKLIENQNDVAADEGLLYTKFIIDIRLKRPHMAAKTLQLLNAMKKSDRITEYANMVFAVITEDKSAAQKIAALMDKHELNAYYYFAKSLVKMRKLGDALKVLDKVASISDMPMAEELARKVRIVQQASAL